MTISGTTQIDMMPPVSNISKDIVTQNDTDSDLALSLEELGIDEDAFSSLDSDSDGLLTSNEIASAIDSQLSSLDSMPSMEEFESLLSDLGLEMPQPPQKPENSDSSDMSSNFASQILSAYDTDGDSLLSAQETSILSEEEFTALDSDGDGSISATELSDAFEQVASTGATPPAGGGAPMGGGSSSEEEEEETYSALDTNEDGIISQAEREAALGISNDENTTTTASTSTDTTQDTLDTIKLLMDTIKLNSENSEEDLDLSSFKNIMKMVNNQNHNQELNSYVGNLSKSTSSSIFNYA